MHKIPYRYAWQAIIRSWMRYGLWFTGHAYICPGCTWWHFTSKSRAKGYIRRRPGDLRTLERRNKEHSWKPSLWR